MSITSSSTSFFFFFNDTATTEIYTLSLHDALPICGDPLAGDLDIAMNLRHAAALALLGWYLRIPPLPQPQVSFNHWQVIESFDSVDQCEQERKDFKTHPPEAPLYLYYQYEIDEWYQRVERAICLSAASNSTNRYSSPVS